MRAALMFSSVVACVLVGLSALAATDDKGFVRIAPDEVQWKELPNGHGVQFATLQGDPTKPGIYVQRVKFPPHVMDRPHWHPEERHIRPFRRASRALRDNYTETTTQENYIFKAQRFIVLKGTWYTGTGDLFDPAHAVPLKPGSYMMHPAKAVHWDGSAGDEEVVVQVIGYGPSGTTPQDTNQPSWVEYNKQ